VSLPCPRSSGRESPQTGRPLGAPRAAGFALLWYCSRCGRTFPSCPSLEDGLGGQV
jgi:hypothetical protein